MPFQAFELAIDLVRTLNPIVDALAQHDPDLARQLRRSRTSVPLNLQEGRRRAGRDRIQLWRVASGSVDEVYATLRTAQAAGYLDGVDLTAALTLCDRLLAITWTLTH